MRVFYNRRLLVILSFFLITVSFSSVAVKGNLLESLKQKQAEIFLMRPDQTDSGQTSEEDKITNPDFALYFPEEVVVTKEDLFEVPLYLKAEEEVQAFGLYFKFNPQVLEARKVTPEEDFQRVPDIFYDNNRGIIRLIAESNNGLHGEKKVAGFQFYAKDTGASKLYFSSNGQGDYSHILKEGVNVIEAVGDGDVFVGE